ncbi:MAG TPA: hypothetical protein VJ965_00665, partial [Anaerolineales bacterium]|nr:hypothetical protein [Anaerolineales bacterium]
VGILPQNRALTDKEGFWANRPIALWPYAQFNDPHLKWGDRFIFVDATYTEGRFKVGWLNLNEWLAYALDDTLFVKSAVCDPTATYYDYQASHQCYCNPSILELETLGPVTLLKPGETATHEERWEVFGGVDFAPDEDQMASLAADLGLETGR